MQKNKNRFFKSLIAIVLVAIIATSMVGCGKVEKDEAVDLVKNLVKESYKLNEIYFGSGLSYIKGENEDEKYYKADSERETLVTKEALVKKTKEVFSESYAEDMIHTAFNGVSNATGTSAVFARYMVLEEDLIYVYYDIEGFEISEYDYSTVEITKIKSKYIHGAIKTTKGVTVPVVLVKEKAGWRLDSATY